MHVRNNVYVNPNYKPPVRRYQSAPSVAPQRPPTRPPTNQPQDTHDVVLNGVAFESSARSLVRKDCK